MPLAYHDDVVEALPTNRADQKPAVPATHDRELI